MSSPLDKLINTCVEIKNCTEWKIGYIKSYDIKDGHLNVSVVMVDKNNDMYNETYSIDDVKVADPEEVLIAALDEKVEKLKQIKGKIISMKNNIKW